MNIDKLKRQRSTCVKRDIKRLVRAFSYIIDHPIHTWSGDIEQTSIELLLEPKLILRSRWWVYLCSITWRCLVKKCQSGPSFNMYYIHKQSPCHMEREETYFQCQTMGSLQVLDTRKLETWSAQKNWERWNLRPTISPAEKLFHEYIRY